MADFNIINFKQTAREKGVPEDQINSYLQNKGLAGPTEKKASGGVLGFMAPVLSLIPQSLGLLYGAKENLKTIEGVHSTIDNQAKIAQDLLKRIQTEKDPLIKEKLRKNLKTVAANQTQLTGLLNDLADGKNLENATAIKLGILADIPGLSTDETRQKQQVIGRSVSQIGASAAPLLGPTAAGGVLGAGRAVEAGGSPLDIVKEAATYAAGAKLLSFGADKIIGTQIGQRVLQSPVGSTILKVGNKIFSPFMVKASPVGTFGADVDVIFRNFGKSVDTMFSPSFYLKGAGKVASAVGQVTGLKESPEQYLETHQAKISKYWQDSGNKYQNIVRNDDGSPDILGREGIIPRQVGNSMSTKAEADFIRIKAGSEHSYLDRILEESGLHGSAVEIRQRGLRAIADNFKGTEREIATRAFNNEFDALLSQNKSQVVGEGRIPIKLVNDMKSYMWSQGYSSKLAPQSERVSAAAMRVAGNSMKTYVNETFKASDPAMADVVVRLNEHTGELLQAAKFLDSMNGKRLPYGTLGRYFARITGAVIGGAAGPVGSIGGTITADQLVNILQNPDISVGKSALIVQQLKQTNPKVVEDAIVLLKRMADTKASQLLLPAAASPSNTVIPVFPKGQQVDYLGTKEVIGSNSPVPKPPGPPLTQGAIPNTTADDEVYKIAFRGEGGGKPRPFYSGNLLGKGTYVFEGDTPDAISMAKSYGDLQKLSYKLKPSEIYDIPTEEALRKLYLDASKAFIKEIPGTDPNDLIPKYLAEKGYKAVRAVGDLARLDPNIGMNIFSKADVVPLGLNSALTAEKVKWALNDIVGPPQSNGGGIPGSISASHPELAEKVRALAQQLAKEKVNALNIEEVLRSKLTPEELKILTAPTPQSPAGNIGRVMQTLKQGIEMLMNLK